MLPGISGAAQKVVVRVPGAGERQARLGDWTAADRSGTNPYTDVLTSYTYDGFGNASQTQVSTTLTSYRLMAQGVSRSGGRPSQTITWHGSLDYQTMGKALSTTVTTWRELPTALDPKVHVTNFGYAAAAHSVEEPSGLIMYTIALNWTDQESGAGYPLEVATAYEYDVFGNAKITTTCDTNVSADKCMPGVRPLDHPYRTTITSYDPVDFAPPAGDGLITSLPYKAGRFPVKQTNAMGHAKYLVYDANFGLVVQETDPNGISACSQYDAYGNKTLTIARCGSANPITTGYSRRLAADPAAPATAATVAVTTPQDGRTSWVYADELGREIETLGRNSGGGQRPPKRSTTPSVNCKRSRRRTLRVTQSTGRPTPTTD